MTAAEDQGRVHGERDDERGLGEDDALLAQLDAGNQWLRAVLCTLARRGAALRHKSPARAERLIDYLSRWPIYRGGQFLFDLMEWEDFMVDGPPPPVVRTVLDAESLTRLAQSIDALRALIDGSGRGALEDAVRAALAAGVDLAVSDEGLPALDPGLYLYPDVVLGVVASVGPLGRADSESP